MFFTDEEWEKIRNVYLLMEPIYFSIGSDFIGEYFDVIEFHYVVHEEKNVVDVVFYYVDCYDYEPGEFYFVNAVRDVKAYWRNLCGIELKKMVSPKWYYSVEYRS